MKVPSTKSTEDRVFLVDKWVSSPTTYVIHEVGLVFSLAADYVFEQFTQPSPIFGYHSRSPQIRIGLNDSKTV